MPIISNPSICKLVSVIATTQEDSYNTYASIIRPGGILLTDSRYVEVTRKSDAKQVELPMYDNVMGKIGKPVVFNICMLGAIVSITEVIKAISVLEAVSAKVPKDFIQLNTNAFELGMELGADFSW